MRSLFLSVVTGALGLAATVNAAPFYSNQTCDAAPTTVFVTASPVTITVYDASTQTLYLSSSEVLSTTTITRVYTLSSTTTAAQLETAIPPTTTITRVSTLSSTTTAPQVDTVYVTGSHASQDYAAVSSPISYDTTITETAMVTVTVQTSVDASTSSPLAFIVENGTTFWYGGHAPTQTGSYVVATSVVTILPVASSDLSTLTSKSTSTLTMESTIFLTQPLTITRTLSSLSSTAIPAFHSSAMQSSGAHVASSFGTGSTVTSTAWAGWNASSTAGGMFVPDTTTLSFSPQSTISFITDETVDLYPTKTTSLTLAASYSAKGGFNEFTESSSSTSTAFPSAVWITATISGVTVAYYSEVAHAATYGSAPYVNSTSAASQAQLTSAALATAVSSTSQLYVYAPYSPSAVSTNTASGIVASSSCDKTIATMSSVLQASATGSGQNTSSTTSWSLNSTKFIVTTFVPETPSFAASSTSTALGAEGTQNTSSTATWTPNSTKFIVTTFAPDTPSFAPSSTSDVLGGGSLVSSFPISAATNVTSMSTRLNGTQPTVEPSVPVSHTDSSFWLTHTSSTFATVATPTMSTESSSAIEGSTAAYPTATAAPSTCGMYTGDFVLNFDDIPPLSVTNISDPNIEPEPIFNPYHKFYFTEGFEVVPLPNVPFEPESKPLLLEFLPNVLNNNSFPGTGPNTRQGGYSGEIGSADYGTLGCFGFNFYGGSFGCESLGPDCDFTFTGYKNDASTGEPQVVATQGYAIPPCHDITSLECELAPIILDDQFRNLDSIRINSTVQMRPKTWYMDDVLMGWFDNSCESGLCRQNAPIH